MVKQGFVGVAEEDTNSGQQDDINETGVESLNQPRTMVAELSHECGYRDWAVSCLGYTPARIVNDTEALTQVYNQFRQAS